MPVHPPYTAPPDAPVRSTFRFILVLMVVPAIALLLWLVLPDSPVTVAVTFLAILALVFGGIGAVLTRRRDMEAEPRRRPMTPPSAR
jgi:membrane protein implicated in regulation of membrane protease activity